MMGWRGASGREMKLLHITGPKYDIDRVMEQYLSRYEIHFENAASGFGISGHVRPFAETNIYKDACTKAQALWEHLKDEPGGAADYAMPVKWSQRKRKSGGSGIPADR